MFKYRFKPALLLPLILGVGTHCKPSSESSANQQEPGARNSAGAPSRDQTNGPGQTGAVPPPSPEKIANPGSAWRDNLPGALAEARKTKRPVFVDAWATWCHTCISMQNYVLPHERLKQLKESFVTVELDTERDVNQAFLSKYSVEVLPSFYVLDGEGRVLGLWQGAASVEEMARFLKESMLKAEDGAMSLGQGGGRGGGEPGSPATGYTDAEQALKQAQAEHAALDYGAAQRSYAAALAESDTSWPNRSLTLRGLIQSHYRAKQFGTCAEMGMSHLAEVKGAAIPADYCSVLLRCASQLGDTTRLEEIVQAVTERLTSQLNAVGLGMSPDDIADAWSIYSYGRELVGDRERARQGHEKGLAVLEEAAKLETEPAKQATFDYGRAKAYLALGRSSDAFKLLTEREQQLPTLSEPPARLSQVYIELGDRRAAIEALSRAIQKAYGPRKLLYLQRKAEQEIELKQLDAARASLKQEVSGWEELAKNPTTKDRYTERLAEARARLAAITK